MNRVHFVGDDVTFHTFHRLGTVQGPDGVRRDTLKIKRPRGRSHIAVNCQAVRDMEDENAFVLIDDRDRFLFMPLPQLIELLESTAELKKPRSGDYWLLDHLLLPPEAEVELGPRIEEQPAEPSATWVEYKFADVDRAFEEVREDLDMASTFYNPTAARLIKELPPQFDLVMIDRTENKILLGRKN